MSPPQLSSIDVIASALEPVIPIAGRMSSPDGAVTLMLSDIADADSMAEDVGAERWEGLLRDHHAIAQQLIGHHAGQVVKVQGDGFLASFASAHAGLHTAVEMQRTFAGAAADPPLPVRIGLHSGFVMGGGGDMMGRNVVLAARIATQAKGGEILVSDALRRYTESDPSFDFEDRGEHHFKGLVGEHAVYAVSWR